MLCPYGLMKGDLKLQGSKAHSRTVATKKTGKQTQLAHHVAVSLGNAEPAIARGVVIFTHY
jgi:hypothetical protein